MIDLAQASSTFPELSAPARAYMAVEADIEARVKEWIAFLNENGAADDAPYIGNYESIRDIIFQECIGWVQDEVCAFETKKRGDE